MSNNENNHGGENGPYDQMTPEKIEAAIRRHAEGVAYHFRIDDKKYTVDHYAYLTANTKKSVLKLPDGRLFLIPAWKLVTSIDDDVENILEAKEV